MIRVPVFVLVVFYAIVVSVPQTAWSASARDQLLVNVIVEGAGPKAVRHARVAVHYTGWLKNGKKFDSSLDRGEPFEFVLGARQVIPGWDQGVKGMKVGEKRELIIPPRLAYGSRGAGDAIPPNSTLKFEITLISLELPGYTNIDDKTLTLMLSKGAKVIDVRRPDEWASTGIIKGSFKITAFDQRGKFVRGFSTQLEEVVSKNDPVVLVCRSGNRSSLIAKFLAKRRGYSNVYNVDGGIVMWLGNGNPVVK